MVKTAISDIDYACTLRRNFANPNVFTILSRMSTKSSLKFRQDLCKHCLKKTGWQYVYRKCILILTSLALQVYKSAFDEPSYQLYFESNPQQTALGVPPSHYIILSQIYIQAIKWYSVCMYIFTCMCTHTHTCVHKHRHTNTQIDRQTDRQAN